MRQRYAADDDLGVARRRAAFDRRRGFRGKRLHLAHHKLCRFVLAQALERGLAHAVAMRPAVEIDLGDKLRLDPDRRTHAALLLRHRLQR